MTCAQNDPQAVKRAQNDPQYHEALSTIFDLTRQWYSKTVDTAKSDSLETFVDDPTGRIPSSIRQIRAFIERLAGGKTISQMQAEDAKWLGDWRKVLIRNMAWFPLTIHWSLEQGIVSELTVGTLGSIPGIMAIRDLWNSTAASE